MLCALDPNCRGPLDNVHLVVTQQMGGIGTWGHLEHPPKDIPIQLFKKYCWANKYSCELIPLEDAHVWPPPLRVLCVFIVRPKS